MELPFGGTFAKDTFETGTRAAAFGGTTTIIDFAVQSQRQVAARGPRCLARQGRGQRRHRLRLPHDHERRQRRHPRRDGRAGRRGRHRLQAVHGLPGRLLQRRRRDLPGDAADRQERRPDHDARRERHGHRRRRGRQRRRGHDRPLSATASRATRSSRARRPTASSASPRRPACPSTSSTCRRATRSTRSARRATAGRTAFAETCPQYLFLSLDDMGNGFEGAKFVCSPPLRPADHQDELWTGLVKDDLQVVSTDHCPFDFHGQKELGQGRLPQGPQRPARRRGPARPDARRRRRRRPDQPGALGRDRLGGAGQACSGCTRARARSRSASDADLVVYDPNRQHTISASDPPHGRRLLVLRGPDASRAAATSC